MKAEIITIGDEILIGQITDTNSKWMAEQLNLIGITVHQITSIQDSRHHIIEALNQAQERADCIFITGGLGPTKDDITKMTLSDYFEDILVMNEEVKNHIISLFAKINYAYTTSDLQQAMLPQKAIALKNKLGTAAGMWFSNNNKVIVSMPGVPNEMKGLMRQEVLPKLQQQFNLPYIIHKTINTYGLGESRVAERIEPWENQLPQSIRLAYLPSYGKLRLRLSATGWDKLALQEAIDQEVFKLHRYIGELIVDEDRSIDEWIHQQMIEKQLTLSLAESCTGGALSSLITKLAGASSYFLGSVVSYSAKAKIKQLKVEPSTIEKYSVVSAEVAKEMAVGCQVLFNSDYAIAITGNAGPTTDKTDERVGVVYIAIANRNNVEVEVFNFGQPRDRVIEKSVIKALEILKLEILKNNKNCL